MENYKHKINYYETDKMGVTHHSNYVRFMEESRIDFLEKIGWGYDKMEQEGIISPVVSLECNYRNTTTYPDVIEVSVQVLKLSAFKLTFGYTMKVKDKVVFTGKSSHCFLDSSGKPVMMESKYPELFGILKNLQDSE